jgi:hypothetical protein
VIRRGRRRAARGAARPVEKISKRRDARPDFTPGALTSSSISACLPTHHPILGGAGAQPSEPAFDW